MVPNQHTITSLLHGLFIVFSNVSASSGGCVWVPTWQAYCCRGLQHHMMVIESMDADSETRRISPLAVVGGDTGPANYTDLMNGPMDHGV